MQIDYNTYRPEHLKTNDRKTLDAIEDVRQSVTNESVVEDFIDTKDVGSTIQSIYRDVLKEFVNYLSERVEYAKVDFIIGCIDNYSDEEFNALRKAAGTLPVNC